jgi:hypothetical protein
MCLLLARKLQHIYKKMRSVITKIFSVNIYNTRIFAKYILNIERHYINIMPSETAIKYQTDSINSKIPQINDQSNTYKEKSKYQMEMYESVKFVNQLLLMFYIVLFSVIHLFILVEYVKGAKRDEIADTVWISVFFFYPYLMYYIESSIYFAVTYFLSLIYGQTYVYQFDQLLLFTDFYSDPGTEDQTIFSK